MFSQHISTFETIQSNTTRHTIITSIYSLIFILLCLFGQTVNAAWTPIGINNSQVNAIVIDPITPGTIYAGTTSGIFKSTDNGASWTKNNAGMDKLYVRSLAIDPASPSTIYAGTDNGDVYKSTDGARSWHANNNGLNGGGEDIYSIAIDPLTPSTIYLGAYGGGVYKSTDGGTNWNIINTGLGHFAVRDLAIDPHTPGTLYVATYGGDGVYKSTDSGGNWTVLSSSLPSLSTTIAIDPETPNTLYVGSHASIYKSIDGGVNWTSSTISEPDTVHALVIDPDTPTTLYAGIYRGYFNSSTSSILKSTDGGQNWGAHNTGLDVLGFNPQIYALAINPASPDTLYAGTDQLSIFKTTDAGNNWNQVNGLLGPSDFFTIDPSNPSAIYIGTNIGAYKSIDNGINWSLIYDEQYRPGSFKSIYKMIINPSEPDILYITNTDGVYKSTDGGSNWINIHDDTHASGYLAIDPIDHNTLYTGTDEYYVTLYDSWGEWNGYQYFPGSLLKSTDGGTSWISINDNFIPGYPIGDLIVDPIIPTTMYANTGYDAFKTIDGGTTWSHIGMALSRLELDPLTPSTIYANPFAYDFDMSTDGGNSWSRGINGSVPLYDPFVPTTRYKSASDGHILKSTDNGSNWSVFSGKPDNPQMRLVSIAPTTPLTFYAKPFKTSLNTFGDSYYDSVYKYTLGSTPDKFTFSDAVDVALNITITSSIVRITGLEAGVNVDVSITGGEYSINGGMYTTNPETVGNGDLVTVHHTSASTPDTTVNTTLAISGVSDIFSSTTTTDTTPNQFSYYNRTGAQLNYLYNSTNSIQVSGINVDSSISITGGEYSINGGAWTSASGTVSNLSRVLLRQTSSSLGNTQTDAILTIGGVSATFSLTTKTFVADTTPNQFSYYDRTDAQLNQLYNSTNSIQVSGITADAAISISGGEYSIDGGAWTSASATVSNLSRVLLRQTSAFTGLTQADTVLTIGGVSATFSTTTKAESFDTTPNQFSYYDRTGAQLNRLFNSTNSIQVSGINADAVISITGGEYSIDGGAWTSASGSVSVFSRVLLRQTSAATNNTQTDTVLTIGGVSATFSVTTKP